MKNRRNVLIEKELAKICKAEERLKKAAVRSEEASWKAELVNKIPPKAYDALEKAFVKSFAVIFEKGTGLIEKTFNKDAMEADYEIHDYAIKRKGGRKEIRGLRKEAAKTDFINMAASTVEGIGLGVFGIGIPDIALFAGMLLKGIYQAALHYGIDYEKPQEKYFILKMMEASMAKGEAFIRLSDELNSCVAQGSLQVPAEQQLKAQLEKTADAFAADMLLQKFIQGLPVVGILGGAGNPVYYRRVMRYVNMQYQKRYLLRQTEAETKKDGDTLVIKEDFRSFSH